MDIYNRFIINNTFITLTTANWYFIDKINIIFYIILYYIKLYFFYNFFIVNNNISSSIKWTFSFFNNDRIVVCFYEIINSIPTRKINFPKEISIYTKYVKLRNVVIRFIYLWYELRIDRKCKYWTINVSHINSGQNFKFPLYLLQ